MSIGRIVVPMPLSQVLDHPSLRAADPVLRAGLVAAASATVRWVHSSEVLDIAPLLRGGELLLCGGVTLASATPEQRRRYATELASRKVAGLAVEVGGQLPTSPRDLVQAADDVGLPLVELRKVVPFVEVAEAINSVLVNDSVVRLRRADALSHSLSAELTHGAGLGELVALLAREVSARVTLVDRAGALLVGAEPDGSGSSGSQPPPSAEAVYVDVPVRGVVVATMRLDPGPDGDVELARVAGERTVDAIALALLRHRPPSAQEVAGAELLRSVLAGDPSWRLEQLCTTAGLAGERPVVGVRGRVLGAARRPGLLEQLLRRRGRPVVAHVVPDEVVALVGLPSPGEREARRQLLFDLAGGLEQNALAVAVGPISAGIAEALRSLDAARLSLDLAPAAAGMGSVLDAEELVVERLAARHLNGSAAEHLVEELLGEVVRYEAARGLQLVETLDVWLSTGCSTTETARRLHLQRQSLHHRLQRIFELIGGDPRGTQRMAGLHLAVRLARSGGSLFRSSR